VGWSGPLFDKNEICDEFREFVRLPGRWLRGSLEEPEKGYAFLEYGGRGGRGERERGCVETKPAGCCAPSMVVDWGG